MRTDFNTSQVLASSLPTPPIDGVQQIETNYFRSLPFQHDNPSCPTRRLHPHQQTIRHRNHPATAPTTPANSTTTARTHPQTAHPIFNPTRPPRIPRLRMTPALKPRPPRRRCRNLRNRIRRQNSVVLPILLTIPDHITHAPQTPRRQTPRKGRRSLPPPLKPTPQTTPLVKERRRRMLLLLLQRKRLFTETRPSTTPTPTPTPTPPNPPHPPPLPI